MCSDGCLAKHPVRQDRRRRTLQVVGNILAKAKVRNGKAGFLEDADQWTEAGKSLDGTKNKFTKALKDFPREGLLGFQDHGQPCWFKNIKLKKL